MIQARLWGRGSVSACHTSTEAKRRTDSASLSRDMKLKQPAGELRKLLISVFLSFPHPCPPPSLPSCFFFFFFLSSPSVLFLWDIHKNELFGDHRKGKLMQMMQRKKYKQTKKKVDPEPHPKRYMPAVTRMRENISWKCAVDYRKKMARKHTLVTNWVSVFGFPRNS